jgi:hypothetical protein
MSNDHADLPLATDGADTGSPRPAEPIDREVAMTHWG